MRVEIKKISNFIELPDELPQVTDEYFYNYGVKQAANDQLASLQRKNYADDRSFEEACRDKLRDWSKRMIAGDVPGHRTPKPDAAAAKLGADIMSADPEVQAQIMALLAGKKPTETTLVDAEGEPLAA